AEPGDRPGMGAALAAAFSELDEDTPASPLLGFLEQLALVGDADAAEGGERVSLMTLHAAKGLEFDAVWMTGLEERVFPSSRSLGQSGPGREGVEGARRCRRETRRARAASIRAPSPTRSRPRKVSSGWGPAPAYAIPPSASGPSRTRTGRATP